VEIEVNVFLYPYYGRISSISSRGRENFCPKIRVNTLTKIRVNTPYLENGLKV